MPRGNKLLRQLEAMAAQSGVQIELGPVALLPDLDVPPDPTMPEAEFTQKLIGYAQARGWKVAHFRPARVLINGEETWRTAVAGDGVGWPDLFLARPRADGSVRLIVVELKSERGEVRPDQEIWLALFSASPVETYEWRPKDWPEVQKVLEEDDQGGSPCSNFNAAAA